MPMEFVFIIGMAVLLILCVKVIYIIGKAFCWCYLSRIDFFYHIS